jgi:MYXO-CTERM domain-containing protein
MRVSFAVSSLATALLCTSVAAQVPVQRTRFELPSSNGHGALLVDLDDTRRVTQFREHPYAAEEPQLDAAGEEIWNGSGFAAVHTRDVLFDAYFGVRTSDGSVWLPSLAVDLDASGYLGVDDDATGGTGIVTIVQQHGALVATTHAFMPMDLPHAGFVMALELRNDGNTPLTNVQAFSLHNFHLGSGRPASSFDVGQDNGSNGETLEHTQGRFDERGFAGVVVTRALAPVDRFGTTEGDDPYLTVAGGADLLDNPPNAAAVDDAVGAWQYDVGTLDPGETAWVGIVAAHWGDPFAQAEVDGWLTEWIDDRDVEQIVADERSGWADFHAGLTPPTGDAYESMVVRQSAAMLRMGQVRESDVYLRQWLDQDGVVRRTRLPTLDDPAELPGTVTHRGTGAVLASLPPGNWTYAWIRDGAYAIAAMARLGMDTQARDGLQFYLEAEAGRFADWQELEGYDMPPYQISLVRYQGFGVEETDFNDFGPNLELDGFGLFLWALATYVDTSGDLAFVEDAWPVVSERVADVIVAMVEPSTGLLRPDSSIWETHWNGRERHWAYTNIVAARGLCDAAQLAEQLGDRTRADGYRETAIALRTAIAEQLRDGDGAIASNTEELATGSGHVDAAVLDAIAMGLFDPTAETAIATLAALDAALLAEAGEVGWSRNDDRFDHGGGEDLSPWGSDYDSAEWVVTDLRGAIATRAAGDTDRSDAILQWVTAQSFTNFGMVAETYDEVDGTYKFNTPMLGFGAGAYTLALLHRDGLAVDAACGEFFEGGGGDETGDTGDTGDTSASGSDDTSSPDTGTGTATADDTATAGATISATLGDETSSDDTTDGSGANEGGGCGCRTDSRSSSTGWLALFGLGLVRRRRRLLAAAVLATACGGDTTREVGDDTTGDDTMTTIEPTTLTSSATADTSVSTTDSADTSGTDDDSSTGDPTGGTEVEVCPTAFAYADGNGISAVRIAGEWQGFDLPTAVALEQDGDAWRGTIDLAPGLHAYKVVVDDGSGTQWLLDPGQGRRKYVDDVENSAVLVPDCNLPSFVVEDSAAVRPSAGAGEITATLRYVDGAPGDGPEVDAFTAVLRHDFDERTLTSDELVVDAESGDVTIAIGDLDDGKYTIVVTAVDRGGRSSTPLRLPIWIEAEAFDWRDAVVYMVMTDRFANGDASNDPDPTPNADPRGDFLGGDFDGVRAAIEDGSLDALGVRAIWLSPFHENPEPAFLASDGVHFVTGYHGYWPIDGRAVDARLGGEAALRDMVAAAHAHGIRILQDYVINHVHEDHTYVAEHPDWFRTGCVCGTPGCDWTVNALECTFTEYLPDIDHRVPEANAAFVDDAVWWLDSFDLDGLRVDAVKHVEEAATRNLAAAVREGFEAAGTRYFLMGETAMGWNDCPDPCNDENYATISRYVGPHGLDGQFDFVLYHGVSYRVFAYGDNGMLHADYWFDHGQSKWPDGAVMTPYIGSHDTARFASIADYRGQDPAHDRGIPGNQWDNIAVAPSDGEPYRRARIAFAWLLGLPGAPLLYYGDEYGQWGGSDPNNRLMWRSDDALSDDEADTLAFVRELGQARRDVFALRRGEYLSLGATEDTLVFARHVGPGDAAIVALTRAGTDQQIEVDVVQLGLDPGTVLDDVLGGPGATVDGGGDVTIDVPASGAVILIP